MSAEAGQHGAAGSALGYLFQVQWGLLELLRRARVTPDAAMTFEVLDDIQFDDPMELVEVKHHVGETATLTDKSVDLWRTLAVWMDAEDKAERPEDVPASLVLVTTAKAADGSAAAALRPDGRRPDLAVPLLVEAAGTSTNQQTADARGRFLGLSPEQRDGLVDKVTVLDETVRIGTFQDVLATELVHVLPRGREESFLDRLQGWWLRTAAQLLAGGLKAITPADVGLYIADLRDQFGPENLPTDVDLEDFDEASAETYRGRHFVRQLDLIAASAAQLLLAIRDYHRAYTQRSRWLREDLVGMQELDRFEQRLREEWEHVFEDMVRELPETATDDDKERAGRALLRALGEQSQARIRPLFHEGFMTRGSLHGLADEPERDVGWHPEFRERLEELLLADS
jgi:hypothetical protein